MRNKILMLLAFFCTMSIGWAQQVTEQSQLSNDKVYTITSARAFLLYSEKVPNQICGSTGTSVGTVTQDNTDPNQQFRIEKIGENYYLYSIGAEKYVNSDGTYGSEPNAVFRMEKVSDANYPWKLTLGPNGMNSQERGQMAAGIVVNNWTTTDAGNKYKIEEATPVAAAYSVVVLGTEEASAGVSFGGQNYGNGSSIETELKLTSADLTAATVLGKIAVVTISNKTIYVSYLYAATKCYARKNG